MSDEIITTAPARPVWMFNLGLAIAFLVLSWAGAGLLAMPAATYPNLDKPFYFNDALFTAVSALCVTGLPLRDTGATFTPFGQTVILALIQIGGLGVMILGTVLGLSIFKKIRVTVPGEPAGRDPGLIGRTILIVVMATFAFELAGAAFMYPMFMTLPGTSGNPIESAWYSVFHSISAFCNAGFSLYENKLMQGVAEGWSKPVREHWQVMGVIAPLIVIGGLGFPVLQDLARFAKAKLLRRSIAAGRQGLTLQTKLVLTTTVGLIVLGASGIMLIERPISSHARASGAFVAKIEGPAERAEYDWVNLGQPGRIRESFFQSISARTAGFNTIDLSRLSNGGKLWMSCLMIVGASPASTGGGMKTVTLALLLLAAWTVLCRRQGVHAFNRRVSPDMLRNALALTVLFLALIGAVTLAVTLTMDPRESFIDIFFESCSACSNVGLSAGLTPKLTEPAKTAIMLGIFLGRLLPMMLMATIAAGPKTKEILFPTEEVLCA